MAKKPETNGARQVARDLWRRQGPYTPGEWSALLAGAPTPEETAADAVDLALQQWALKHRPIPPSRDPVEVEDRRIADDMVRARREPAQRARDEARAAFDATRLKRDRAYFAHRRAEAEVSSWMTSVHDGRVRHTKGTGTPEAAAAAQAALADAEREVAHAEENLRHAGAALRAIELLRDAIVRGREGARLEQRAQERKAAHEATLRAHVQRVE